jgi:hypothetical protein
MPELANPVNADLSRGFTVARVAEKHACPACPACPVGPEDRTGVAPGDGTGVGPEDRTGATLR